MVEVLAADDKGFNFEVRNGRWYGRFQDGQITLVNHKGAKEPLAVEYDFVEVLNLTEEERAAWYVPAQIEDVPEEDEDEDMEPCF